MSMDARHRAERVYTILKDVCADVTVCSFKPNKLSLKLEKIGF